MVMTDPNSVSARVAELAEEFIDRQRRGERPSLGEYIGRHPDLAEEIRQVFPAMAMIEDLALDDESLTCELPATTSTARRPILERLGDYQILREVGHGGMGVVYEAEQVSLGRHVALKVLPPRALRDTN
jgi:serine/threonine protein kinase